MKIRAAFVANSSSSSFCVRLDRLAPEQQLLFEEWDIRGAIHAAIQLLDLERFSKEDRQILVNCILDKSTMGLWDFIRVEPPGEPVYIYARSEHNGGGDLKALLYLLGCDENLFARGFE
jgi:hypothetical protein